MGNDWKMASERNAPAPQAASLRFARVMGSLKLGGTVVGELRCVSSIFVKSHATIHTRQGLDFKVRNFLDVIHAYLAPYAQNIYSAFLCLTYSDGITSRTDIGLADGSSIFICEIIVSSLSFVANNILVGSIIDISTRSPSASLSKIFSFFC